MVDVATLGGCGVWKVKREGVRGGGEGGGGETGVWIMDELSCIGDTATTP